MPSPGQQGYLNELQRCQQIVLKQEDIIDEIADHIYQSLVAGGVLHVFGSGHSHVLAEELFHRAGGLIPVNAILEEYLMPHMGPSHVGPLERLPGIAQIIFQSYDLRPQEVILLNSNSGINAATVELAQLAKEKGLITVAITSLTHSAAVNSRIGKKLFEVTDYALDTGTPVGDACVSLKGYDVNIAPLSTIVSVLIAQLLVIRVCEFFEQTNRIAPVYQSANTPGGDERNKKLEQKYKLRIRRLN